MWGEPQRTRDRASEQLDTRWFQRFAEAGNFQAYEYFAPENDDGAEQKKAFLDGDAVNPLFDYSRIDLERFRDAEAKLRTLKQEISEHEPNEGVRLAYKYRINEKLAEILLVKAAAAGDMRNFDRFTRFVYGEPSKEIFAMTMGEVRTTIDQAMASGNADAMQSASRLAELVVVSEAPPDIASPSAEVFLGVKGETVAEFEHALPAGVEGPFSAEQIRDAFDSALKSLGVEGWTVLTIESSTTAVNTSQERREVTVPSSRTIKTKRKLNELILHELGTHVLRRENGERSRLMLLGLGLDRYEGFEEGVATLREDTRGKEFSEYAGLDGHFAVGLARGLDGRPRDFRETYTVLREYFLLKKLLGGKTTLADAESAASESAWKRTLRTFRRTDATTPGVCFTKDMIYREGNIAAWQVASTDLKSIETWNVGKFDGANPRHLYILRTLGILDEEVAPNP